MTRIIFASISAALLLVACTGKENKAVAKPSGDESAICDVLSADLQRTWLIENVVVNDSLYARPSEIDPQRNQYFTFADGTFAVNTNCNTLGGEYELTGDSIIFKNIMTTEMACDNMDVEQLIMHVLPDLRSVDCINDSVTRLNSATSAYIVLRKIPPTDI